MKRKAQLHLPTYHDGNLANNKLGPEWPCHGQVFKAGHKIQRAQRRERGALIPSGVKGD